jgi:hemoglobin
VSDTPSPTSADGGSLPAPAPLTLRASEGGDAAAGNFYDQVGGHETFQRLVDAFYRGVSTDPVLRPMYPEQDLGPAADRLRMFWNSTGAGRPPTGNGGGTRGCACDTCRSR